MDERTRALQQIATIARHHGLSASEIAAALDTPAVAPAAPARGQAILVRVLGFLGGTFVFAGIGVFIGCSAQPQSTPMTFSFISSAQR